MDIIVYMSIIDYFLKYIIIYTHLIHICFNNYKKIIHIIEKNKRI